MMSPIKCAVKTHLWSVLNKGSIHQLCDALRREGVGIFVTGCERRGEGVDPNVTPHQAVDIIAHFV